MVLSRADGRGPVMEELMDDARVARTGRRPVWIVYGPLGSGKTDLVWQLWERLRARPGEGEPEAVVLSGSAAPINNCSVRSISPTRLGSADQSSATAPTTCGPAMEVPLFEPYAPPGRDERMSTPGAAISGFMREEPSAVTGPRLLK